MAMPTMPAVPTSIGLCFRVTMVRCPQGTNLNRRCMFPGRSALDEAQHRNLRRLVVGHRNRVCGNKGGHKQGGASAQNAEKKSLHGEQNDADKASFRPAHISEQLPVKFHRLRRPRPVESRDLCFEVWRVAYPDEPGHRLSRYEAPLMTTTRELSGFLVGKRHVLNNCC